MNKIRRLICPEESWAELKAINSKLNNVEEQISDLEDRIMEINQSEQQTEGQI